MMRSLEIPLLTGFTVYAQILLSNVLDAIPVCCTSFQVSVSEIILFLFYAARLYCKLF
jgi:hypothetical protein